MPTIALSMIVKDESAVILRCLDSVRSLIDAAVVIDTGSQDGTPDLVRGYLARHGLSGLVIEEPWRDFAANRTFALAALRAYHEIDYALVLDADDCLVFDAGCDPAAFKAGLWADVYEIEIRHGGTVYRRPQLFSNRLPFAYRSILHEYLVIPPSAQSCVVAAGVGIRYGADGARSRSPSKFARDAALLEAALADEADPRLRARYAFYLAQSYRDDGQPERAIAAYRHRAELGQWDEEVFSSLLNAGELMAGQGAPTGEVLAVLGQATDTIPHRVEARHAAARICRERGEHAAGLAVAAPGLGRPQPDAGLFLRPAAYTVGLLDEYAVNAYWTGRDIDCLVACAVLLARRDLDPDTRARVRANRDHAYGRLEARASPWLATLDARSPRIAVITSYGAEPPDTLQRCLASVKRQTLHTDHIFVATGSSQAWLDGAVARHVVLGPEGSRGQGAALSVGGLLAASSDYAAICLLDPADWYDEDHVERCLVAALSKGLDACGFAAASRRFVRPDLTPMPLADEDPETFVATSGYLFLPAAFGLCAAWALTPAALGPIADRVFFQTTKAGADLMGLATARTHRPTVNCIAPYAAFYEALGEAAPAKAEPLPDHGAHRAWIDALPPEALASHRARLGIDLRDLYRTPRDRPKGDDNRVAAAPASILQER